MPRTVWYFGSVRDVVTSSSAGEVVPDKRATVRAELGARVSSVKHERGDRVKRGELIVALDDAFVVPIPTTMKVVGFFRVADTPLIATEARDDAVRKLADASSGWNAVAVGSAGRPGLAVQQASEQAAVNEALSECTKRDSNCHVVAIGPFTVGPN